MDPALATRTTFRHPMMRPGVRVTRRDEAHLQVGLEPGTALVVPDNEEVRALLNALRSGCLVDPQVASSDVWRALEHRDQIVDADAYFHQLPRPTAAQRSRAALFAQHPRDAAWRLIARAGARVTVDADHLGDVVLQLLGSAGVGARVGVSEERPTVALVIADGEIRRSRLDRFMQSGTPHLLVSHSEGRLCVGPFVEPGRTACLRCVDAQLGERDPRRGLIVEQYADTAIASAVAEPYDETSSLLAVSIAVADVIAYVDGDRPASWSTTIDIGPGLDLPRTLWKRHPRCGCSWV